MQNIQIKRTTVNDIETLIQLGRQTFIETYKNMGEGRPEGLEETYGRETFNYDKLLPILSAAEEDQTQPLFYIAWIENTPAGFMKLEFDLPIESVPDRTSVHFSQAYLLRPFQGKGLGRSLLDEAKSQAKTRNRTGLWLGVWDQNKAAIEFYKKMGFKKVGTTEWKFTHGAINYTDIDDAMYLGL